MDFRNGGVPGRIVHCCDQAQTALLYGICGRSGFAPRGRGRNNLSRARFRPVYGGSPAQIPYGPGMAFKSRRSNGHSLMLCHGFKDECPKCL